MPLPDERPRQSVANLIGRFETTNQKRGGNSDKPIQLPGRVVSGKQERKTSLGPTLASTIARNTPSLPSSASEPPPAYSPEKAEPNPGPTVIDEPTIAQTEPAPVSTPSDVLEVQGPEDVVATQAPQVTSGSEPPKISSTPPKDAIKKKSAPAAKATPPSSSRAPVNVTKVRSPPTSTPMTKSISATHKSTAAHTETQPIRAQHTGNSSIRGVVSPVPHYMMPLRAQNTGSQTDTKVRSKTPVTKPRTSNATGNASATSNLMAPTASSLAKARPPVAIPAKSNAKATPTTTVKKLPPVTKSDTPAVPQTPVRERTTSSTVPFPSARKAKTSTGPGSTIAKPKGSTIPASGSRQARISQSSAKGPSAAALAALAKVNAPPVPSIPSQNDIVVASVTASAEDVFGGISEPSASKALPATLSSTSAPSATASDSMPVVQNSSSDAAPTTVVEPLADGSGHVLVADAVEGAVTAPPARPLTDAALGQLDDAVDSAGRIAANGNAAISGEANGGTSVLALNDGEPGAPAGNGGDEDKNADNGAPVSASTPTPVPASPAVPSHHELDTVPPPPTSPSMGTDHAAIDSHTSSVDPVVGPVPTTANGDELKDDAHVDNVAPTLHPDVPHVDPLGIDE